MTKKKLLLFFILSVILTTVGTTAYSATTSLIGKAVQNEVLVFLNEDEFLNKAIIIDGISYLPVREMGEKLELNVNYSEGIISVTDHKSQQSDSSIYDTYILKELTRDVEKEIEIIKKHIDFHQSEFDRLRSWVENPELDIYNQLGNSTENTLEFHEKRLMEEKLKLQEAELRYNNHSDLLESILNS